MYKKIQKKSLAKHYQKTEKGYKKGFLKGPENLSEKEKKNSNNLVTNNIRIFLIMNNKNWLTIENIIIKCGKIKTLHDKTLALKAFRLMFYFG